ncbi:MAG: hypothetical protein ACPGSC_01880 [Granulosicoccaceae bacterium]
MIIIQTRVLWRRFRWVVPMLVGALLQGCDGGLYGTGSGPKPLPGSSYETRSMPQTLQADPPVSLLSRSAVAPSDKGRYETLGLNSVAPCAAGSCDDMARSAAARQTLVQQLNALTRTVLDAEEIALSIDASLEAIRDRCATTANNNSCEIDAGEITLTLDVDLALTMFERHRALLLAMASIDTAERLQIDQALIEHYLTATGQQTAPAMSYRRSNDSNWTDEISLTVAPLSSPEANPLDLHIRWRDGEPDVLLSLENRNALLSLQLDVDVIDGYLSSTSHLTLDTATSENTLSLALAAPSTNNRGPVQLDARSRIDGDSSEQRFNWNGQADSLGGFLRTQDDLAIEGNTSNRLLEESFDAGGETLAGGWCDLAPMALECALDWTPFDATLPTATDVDEYYIEAGSDNLEQLESDNYRVTGLSEEVVFFAVIEKGTNPALSDWLCDGMVLPNDEQSLFCWADALNPAELDIIDTTDLISFSLLPNAQLVMTEP